MERPLASFSAGIGLRNQTLTGSDRNGRRNWDIRIDSVMAFLRWIRSVTLPSRPSSSVAFAAKFARIECDGSAFKFARDEEEGRITKDRTTAGRNCWHGVAGRKAGLVLTWDLVYSWWLSKFLHLAHDLRKTGSLPA